MRIATGLKVLLGLRSWTTITLGVFPSPLLSRLKDFSADLVVINWFGDEAFSISQVRKIDKPVVIVLHDLWFLEGIEHVPSLHQKSIMQRAVAKLLYSRKVALIKRKQDLYFVSPSRQVERLFKNKNPALRNRVLTIGHPVFVDEKTIFTSIARRIRRRENQTVYRISRWWLW